MKILCISASNVQGTQGHGTSTKVCEMAQEMIIVEHSDAEVQILRLFDYDLKPCLACGRCFHVGKCHNDEGFNEIYAAMEAADGIVIVTPHYALAPAKLVMLLEKIQEKGYFLWLGEQIDRFTLPYKPVAIIGHGGSTQNFEQRYRRNLLDGVGEALGLMGLQIVGAGEEWHNGVVFGITATEPTADPLLMEMVHEWDAVKQLINPLMKNLLQAVQTSTEG